MADLADVEVALVSVIANAIYPNGTAVPSVIGNTCRVYRGLPTAPALDADLAAGVLHACVLADGPVRNVTRYPRIWQTVAPAPATLLVLAGPESASFSGTCALGQLAGIAVGGAQFAYAVQANDTPATVASNLTSMLRAAGWLVAYAGSTITIPGAAFFTARVVNGAGTLQEIKRQVQEFRIDLWCPDPASRDAAAPVIDRALAAQNFLALSDGSSARVIFLETDVSDEVADARLYKRSLRYSAEYPTTLSEMTPAMLFGTGSFDANAAFVETLQD
jgi:hypothetical protein